VYPEAAIRDAVIFEAGKFGSLIERLTARLIAQSSGLYDENAQLGLRESPGGHEPYDAATHDANVEGLGELGVAFKIKKHVSTPSAGISRDGPGARCPTSVTRGLTKGRLWP
jgi:hypothetical protein